MTDWSPFPPDEIERRRISSVAEMKMREREQWDREYQEICDRMYWQKGQCCAGCDHWHSDMGLTGQCAAAGIVSGLDVINSLGMTFCSYTPPPGLPYSRAEFHCGKFKDEFDWSQLGEVYLHKIGAMVRGQLRPTPTGNP